MTHSRDIPHTCELLIKNGCVLTEDKDRRILRDGALAIDDKQIVDVGPRQALKIRGFF